jgi:hypothetical protein
MDSIDSKGNSRDGRGGYLIGSASVQESLLGPVKVNHRTEHRRRSWTVLDGSERIRAFLDGGGTNQILFGKWLPNRRRPV